MGVKIVQNCLHIAASNGHFKICVKLFQDYSFDIHAKDDDGLSVLHSAVESGDLELFQNLIEYESDVCTETKDLKNCLHIAARNGNVNLCKVRLGNYSFDIHAEIDKGFNAVLCAAEIGDLEMFQYFVKYGSSVSSNMKDGRFWPHVAASKGRFHLMKRYLKHYIFRIEMRCDKGWTILHYAAQSGDLELFKYL